MNQALCDNFLECSNLIFYRKGSCQGCYCIKDKCNYGYFTTYLPDIQRDEAIYRVYIESLGENWQQSVVFLALKFNLSINEARKYKNPGLLLCSGNAVEVFYVREKLRKKQISIAITPDYKYDLWDNSPQGEFTTMTLEGKRLRSLLRQ